MSPRTEYYEASYRSLDDNLIFQFRFRRDAGSSAWRFEVKYGDVNLTHTPLLYHDPGLLLQASNRAELLKDAARWAECVHSFYLGRQSQDRPEIPQLEARNAAG